MNIDETSYKTWRWLVYLSWKLPSVRNAIRWNLNGSNTCLSHKGKGFHIKWEVIGWVFTGVVCRATSYKCPLPYKSIFAHSCPVINSCASNKNSLIVNYLSNFFVPHAHSLFSHYVKAACFIDNISTRFQHTQLTFYFKVNCFPLYK